MLSLIIVERISWTPSCSKGSKEVRRGFSNENHTAFAKLQWKNKCESFSQVAWGAIFAYLGRKILSLSSSGSCSSDKSPNKSFYIRRKELVGPRFPQNVHRSAVNASWALIRPMYLHLRVEKPESFFGWANSFHRGSPFDDIHAIGGDSKGAANSCGSLLIKDLCYKISVPTMSIGGPQVRIFLW
jgi:hypothetical protein